MRIARSREDVEDAIQDAYAKVWHKLDALDIEEDDTAGMERFMCVVARNTYFDAMRKRSRRPAVSMSAALWDCDWNENIPDAFLDHETPEAIALRSEHNYEVDAAFSLGISALTDMHRDLIKAVVSGETPKQYADRNGVNPGTVSFRSWHARQRIKETLGELPFAGD